MNELERIRHELKGARNCIENQLGTIARFSRELGDTRADLERMAATVEEARVGPREALQAARRAVKLLREALVHIEWLKWDGLAEKHRCLVCDAWRGTNKHGAGCLIGNALAATADIPPPETP